jgi:hypothetical protein
VVKPRTALAAADQKEAILQRYRERDPDFGPTLASAKLAQEGFEVDHETLRRSLDRRGAVGWSPPAPSSSQLAAATRSGGELVQLDGSCHHWFEERGPESCLRNMVDDATGVTLSLLAEAETIAAAMTLLWKWIATFGLPAALYPDRRNLYVPDEEMALRARLEGEEKLTQFGRACQKPGIVIIAAHSPQAKRRVERSNGPDQDRLVKELRLARINEISPRANLFRCFDFKMSIQ